jgi:RNA polymerase sigma factor (sigma-70 family)
MEHRSDAAVVSACLAGEEAAWRELVTRYGHLVLSIPRQAGLGEADCQDVFQEVFESLLRQLPRLRDRQSLAKWLMTTTHRASCRWLRRSRRAVSEGPEPRATDAPPLELVVRWERQQMVRQALRRLGGRCAKLLGALYLDPSCPGYEEVARRLGVPRGSIGPTRLRCLARLVEVLRSAGVDDER